MATLVALYRKAAYSPHRHLANDTAILLDTSAHLARLGWDVIELTESRVEAGELPAGDVYLNMCQGRVASEKLLAVAGNGRLFVNTPASVLNCHRHHLVRTMLAAELPFPRTVIVPAAGPSVSADHLAELFPDSSIVWIKRGDVHAERQEDVVACPRGEVAAHLKAFAARGIGQVAIQEHVEGPILKFYALSDGRFFRWYDSEAGPDGPRPAVDEARLRDLAFAAAAALGLTVFGGDVALPAPDRPVLIDMNDWPSFAPFRVDAAAGIAALVQGQWRDRLRDDHSADRHPDTGSEVESRI